LDTGQDRLNHYWRPEDLFHPNTEAPTNTHDEDTGADADSQPAEPDPPNEQPRHPNTGEIGDTGPASNRDEAPDQEATQIMDGHDTDDAPTGEEPPAEPDPWPEVVTSGPEELRPTNADETGDTDIDSNADEAPEHPAQPDAEATRIIGGEDTDDDAVTAEEPPAEPDPWPEVVTAGPEELRPTNAEATGDTDTDSNADEAPEHPAQPDAEATRIIGGEDTDDDAVTAEEPPAEPDPWPEVVTAGPEELRPTNTQNTGDTGTAPNGDEAPEHPAQPGAEPTQTIGGEDTDDNGVTGDEAPAAPGPQPIETAPAPEDPHTSNRQAPADAGNDPAGQALHAAPRPDSHPHTTQRPGNRDGPDDP
ncbi:hypothetical protein, partial [Mycobacterium aquaticum]